MFMCMCGGLPQNWVAATARAPAAKAAPRVLAPEELSPSLAHPSSFMVPHNVSLTTTTHPEVPSFLACASTSRVMAPSLLVSAIVAASSYLSSLT